MQRIFITVLVIAIAFLSCKKDKDKAPPTAPLVKTAATTNNGGGNIAAGGSIISDGGATVTKSGIAWSRGNAMPSITDSVVESTTTTGAFTVNISGIDFGKTYYFRAFATNSIGTGYGDVVTLTTSSDSVRFTYNGQSVTYGIIVSSASGKKWLDRNLGAKQVAAAYNDWQAYGDLFQWGRPADGHQLITWTANNANPNTSGTAVNGTTTVVAASDIPGHNNFIIPPYALPLDWRSDNNRNRWATIPQGPCPNGWHVPTIDEWMAEVSTTMGGTANTGGMKNVIEGYSQLKLIVGGNRILNGPGALSFSQVGRGGHYWSSSDRNNAAEGYTDARDLEIGVDGLQQWTSQKVTAKSVRCIKDN